MDFLGFFFNFKNKALESIQSVSGVQIKVHQGFNESQLTEHQLNPGALSFESGCTFIQPPVAG